MNSPPRDYTSQENTIAKILDEFGLRYDTQHFFVQYIADFWVPEIGMIIEADGVYGHLQKRDIKRDTELMALPMVDSVLHIKETSYKKTLIFGKVELNDISFIKKFMHDRESIQK